MIRNTLAVALMLVGASALAQSTGTVQIQGSTQASVSMRFASVDTSQLTIPGATATNAANPSNALNTTINFNDVTSGVTGTPQAVTIRLALRSNVSYTLSASATGSGVLPPEEIGFAVTGISGDGVLPAPGANVVTPRTDAIQGTFGRTPGTNVTEAGGLAVIQSSLVPLMSGSVPVLTGNRISARGSFLTPTNAIFVDTEYALLPQLFEYVAGANTFAYTINYTIATP